MTEKYHAICEELVYFTIEPPVDGLIQISTSDDLLPIVIDKYTKLIGNHLTLDLQPEQGNKFKLVD